MKYTRLSVLFYMLMINYALAYESPKTKPIPIALSEATTAFIARVIELREIKRNEFIILIEAKLLLISCLKGLCHSIKPKFIQLQFYVESRIAPLFAVTFPIAQDVILAFDRLLDRIDKIIFDSEYGTGIIKNNGGNSGHGIDRAYVCQKETEVYECTDIYDLDPQPGMSSLSSHYTLDELKKLVRQSSEK